MEFFGKILRILRERLTAAFGKRGTAFRVALMALALCVAVSSCSAGVSQTDDDEAENSGNEEENISSEDGGSEDDGSVNAVSISSRNYDPERNVTISGAPDSDSREFYVDNERFRLWKAEPGDSAGRGVSLNVVKDEREYNTYFMQIAVEPESNYVGFKPILDFDFDCQQSDTILSISDEAVADSGIARKAALNEYYTRSQVHIEDYMGSTVCLYIEIYAGIKLDGTVIDFDGELKEAREITVNGMSGLYLSVDASNTGRNPTDGIEQNMLLYSEETNSVIRIEPVVGTLTCEEIAQIAAGLDLLDTGVPASGAMYDCLSIRGPVG